MKCSFCGGEIRKGIGKLLVRNDGKLFRFCDSKCHRNFKMKRQGKKLKWTKLYEKGK